MMERIRFINHQQKRILYVDLSDTTPQEVSSIFEQVRKIVAQQPKQSVRTLANTHNAQFNSDTRQTILDVAKHNKPYVIASAIIGLAGLQKIILNGIIMVTKRKFLVCETMAEAKDWLAQQ